MKHKIVSIADETKKDDVWSILLSPDKDIVLGDLLKLSTDYSCHGCGD